MPDDSVMLHEQPVKVDITEMEDGKLSDFRPQENNANAHTQRGLKALGDAYSEVGYVAPMTAAANGEVLDGSARLEQAFDQFEDEALVIHHSGDRPIIMIRDDVPDSDDPRAKKISYGANRIGEIDLKWNPEQLLIDKEAGIDFSSLFYENEFEMLIGEEVEDPLDEWGGMPEFEQEDKTSFQAIHIHFKDQEAVNEFAALIQQKITDKTRSLWYPEIEIERYADKRYIDES